MNRLTTALMFLMAVPHPIWAVSDEDVDTAIRQLKATLYAKQDAATGGWFGYHKHAQENGAANKNVGGDTAMVLLALIGSGESRQLPAIDRGLRYLRQLEMGGTYALSLRMHVWSALPQEYLSLLESDAEIMLNSANPTTSTFHYTLYPDVPTTFDHSTTQYGILGLWQAAKRGVKVPVGFWKKAENHFLESQLPDGGWSYTGTKSSDTMTCAGLTVLYIVLQEVYRDSDSPPEKVMAAIDRGLARLGKDWTVQWKSTANGPRAQRGYHKYGIERVALASGIKFFGDNGHAHDWYEEIAEDIIKNPAGNQIDAGFHLMFLSRGRVPVWATKLQIPNHAWNRRPNDLWFATRFLSDLREQEINWQTVSIEAEPSAWIHAPLAYIATNQPLQLSERHKIHLKRFVELGGTILLSPDNNHAGFKESAAKLARELFPQYPLKPLPRDHALFNALYRIERPPGFHHVSNDARDLILVSDIDLGRLWQMDTRYETNETWKLTANLYCLVSDRGLLTNRLDVVIPSPAKVGNSAKVARSLYDGNAVPEPGTWAAMSAVMSHHAGIGVDTEDLLLDRIGQTQAPLVHLTGVDAVTLTQDQARAIRSYLDRGGTILIETVGGNGQFAISMNTQLRDILSTVAVPLSTSHPLITGEGLTKGRNASQVAYRRRAILNASLKNHARLAAFMIEGRPAVILSHEDLSLGALKARQFGISGYQSESARDLLTNIVLWSRTQTLRP